MAEVNPDNIVRCYGCSGRVRAKATRLEPTGEGGHEERWCLGCLQGINQYTASLIPDKQAALESATTRILLDEGVTE